MKSILISRWILFKKQWFSHILFLVLPIVGTITIISIEMNIQEDSKVPIAIVKKEDTIIANEFYRSLTEMPYLRIYDLSEREALQKLARHELDSLFIIEKGFAEKIKGGVRNRLLTGYSSDLSFAYIPVKEKLISHIQTLTGQTKTYHAIEQLAEGRWTREEVMEKITEIKERQQLLQTDFTIGESIEETGGETNPAIWGSWAFFMTISALFLFDWQIKEKNTSILPRYSMMKYGYRKYFLFHSILYTLLFFTISFLSMIVFSHFYGETSSLSLLWNLLLYTITICLGAYILSSLFTSTFAYYCTSMIIVFLLLLTNGSIIPMHGIISRYPIFTKIHPMYPFLEQSCFHPWFFIIIGCLIIVYRKEERKEYL